MSCSGKIQVSKSVPSSRQGPPRKMDFGENLLWKETVDGRVDSPIFPPIHSEILCFWGKRPREIPRFDDFWCSKPPGFLLFVPPKPWTQWTPRICFDKLIVHSWKSSGGTFSQNHQAFSKAVNAWQSDKLRPQRCCLEQKKSPPVLEHSYGKSPFLV